MVKVGVWSGSQSFVHCSRRESVIHEFCWEIITTITLIFFLFKESLKSKGTKINCKWRKNIDIGNLNPFWYFFLLLRNALHNKGKYISSYMHEFAIVHFSSLHMWMRQRHGKHTLIDPTKEWKALHFMGIGIIIHFTGNVKEGVQWLDARLAKLLSLNCLSSWSDEYCSKGGWKWCVFMPESCNFL